jgi:starch-binding outer membrane protein, SusD/RagB family
MRTKIFQRETAGLPIRAGWTSRMALGVGILAILLGAGSCSKNFLNYTPNGTVTASDLTSPTATDALVIAAYAALGNDGTKNSVSSMWVWGSIRSDEAYKGGGSITDQTWDNQYEQYNLVTTDEADVDLEWATIFAGIARANTALRAIDAQTLAAYPDKVERQAECRFLRGHFYFLLKEIFKGIPYATETVSADSLPLVSNVQNNDSSWENIAQDFLFAAQNLPAVQTQIGRANKYAAYAYLAKVRLYQAYEQDANNQVTSINTQHMQDVVSYTDSIINSGMYQLSADYADNFTYPGENGPESIFAIQFSINDGTQIGRVDMAESDNYSVAPQYGCCSFHLPSQNMVNAFKTDGNGLPEFGYFNDTSLLVQQDFLTNGIDPRLDHTCAIVGHPFKYQPTILFDSNWVRTPQVYGYHDCMKEIQPATCACLEKVGPYFGSSKNIDILRYDDVLLWQAEAYIQLGQQNSALPLINMLRTRAANSTTQTRFSDGTAPSNYRISTYQPGTNCNWTQDYAFQALQFERRMEFGMEGTRFFDLVRWGIAAQTLNNYISVEKTRFDFLANAQFTQGRDEYLPIPQTEINLTHGLYQQNSGW